ncbi:MAG: hypothetical protein HYT31_00910 [Parcubacteria group bacterium]|nr:hypothetical protein [Parcubacteria group bacterium]
MQYTVDIRAFLKTMALFFAPVFALVGFGIFLAIASGEVTTLQSVVDKQARPEEYLFARRVVSEETAKYKYFNVQQQDVDVLALGSSRVLELRQEVFGGAYIFYNAGNMLISLRDLIDFIDILKEEDAPDIIILGVDMWWFDSSRIETRAFAREHVRGEEAYNWRSYLYASRHLFTALLKDPSYVAAVFTRKDPLTNNHAIGIAAIENGDGFRRDGSRQYGTYVRMMREDPSYVDRETNPVVERAENGYPPFELESSFDERGVALLDEFLEKAQKRGITVIGVAGPFASDAYQAIIHSHYAPFASAFSEQIPPVFTKRGFPFFDFSDISAWGLEDTYMLDGFHATETGISILFTHILDALCSGDIFEDCASLRARLTNVLEDPRTTPAEMYWEAALD